MLVIQLASLLTFAAASASAITIPSYKQTNAQRLRRGLKPLAPTRVYDSARKRQDPVPSNGPVTNLTPHDIQGNGYLSPYVKQTVTGLHGVVTAKASNGFYIQSVIPDTDDSTSEGLFVFGSQSVGLVNVGDIISVDGIVDEYAPNTTAGAAGLRLTELTFPANVKILSSGNTVTPLVLGVDRIPPTSTIYFEDPWQLPSQTVNIEETGQKLDPAKRGLDFWESLEGMLVTVPAPRAVARGRSKAFWAVGSAYATNSGARGGLNLGKVNGLWDTNPEAIYIQASLSGTGPADESINIGSTFQDITGVISYSNGQPVLYPIAPPVLTNSRPAKSDYPRSMILGDDQCKVTLGNYNVLNLNPKSVTYAQLGDHVANFMNLPYALALEEIQDNSGATDDGMTSGSETLRLLVEAIYVASGNTVRYEILEIPPINNEDGGAPGGNIHPAVLYRSDKLELDTFQAGAKGGNADSQTLIKDTTTGETTFALNPALIDPTNSAWTSSRKPLTASFIVKGSTSQRKRLHLIAAHLASKSGSTTTAGREQTYENGAVEARIEQAKVIRDFIKELLVQDPDAHLVLAGDLNEFSGVQPLEVLGEVLTELVVPNPAERYSYQFDQNTQQIDHILTVPKLSTSGQLEILHVNTWGTLKNQASDHDPVLSSFSVC